MAVNLVQNSITTTILTKLRSKTTAPWLFREQLTKLAMILGYEAFKELPTKPVAVTTPVAQTTGFHLRSKIMVVPILRAGMGLEQGVLSLVPQAAVCHLGFYRDEKTLMPHPYYQRKRINHVNDYDVFIIDPMLATGGTSIAAIKLLKKWGAKSITLIVAIASPEGIKAIEALDPKIKIVTAAVDERLNQFGFIVPGMGDAGDRVYNTVDDYDEPISSSA